MSQQTSMEKSPVELIIHLIDHQREQIFAELAGISERHLWHRSGENEWSIGENLDHMGVIYTSMLPFFRFTWMIMRPLAGLLRRRPYQVEIDNVYRRPHFPQKVGWIWPPKHTPDHPASLAALHENLKAVHGRVVEFYLSREPDLLGHTILWDPAIGSLNLIQALRVGAYHDEVHIDSIRQMVRDLPDKSFPITPFPSLSC